MALRLPRALAACLLAVMLAPAAAAADGDPASDILLAESVFYPYKPPVSVSLERSLDAETAAAARAHFPIKVAIIGSPMDLGAIPQLFGRAQAYADFLEQEIDFQGRQLLLVVMPSGYGVQGLGRAPTLAAASLVKPAGTQTDDLARAALAAVPKLASAASHPLGPVTTPSTTSTGGSTAVILVIVAVAAAGSAGTLVAVRRRRVPIR